MHNSSAGELPILVNCKQLQQLTAQKPSPDAIPGNMQSGNVHANTLLIVDVGKAEQFAESHIEGARPVEYAAFVRSEGKTGGLLPTLATMQSVMQQLGASRHSHIVCYDRQGGSAASRLIWTLHAFGFTACSLLNGGLETWIAAGYPTVSGSPNEVTPANDPPQLVAARSNVVNSDELLKMINENQSPALLDARSRGEYDGEDVRSARGGHIPGARWLEWTTALDTDHHKQLLSDDELLRQITAAGFKRDETIVAYCQTHQRSSLSYVILKHLGFDNVMGLEGAWSEWGNRDDTPVEK